MRWSLLDELACEMLAPFCGRKRNVVSIRRVGMVHGGKEERVESEDGSVCWKARAQSLSRSAMWQARWM